MQQDLLIIAGYSFAQPFKIVAIDETNAQYDYDLSNSTVQAVAKPTATSCKSYVFNVTITDAATGKFFISMDSSFTNGITESSLVYDIRVIDNTNDNSFRAVYGKISVEKEVTP